jgi:hypothetical protein
MSSTPERRRYERLPLRLPVRVSRTDGSPPIDCFTENISARGFYCIVREPMVPGERLEAEVILPGRNPGGRGGRASVRCKVQVIRIDSRRGSPGFGIAFQIANYKFLLEDIATAGRC